MWSKYECLFGFIQMSEYKPSNQLVDVDPTWTLWSCGQRVSAPIRSISPRFYKPLIIFPGETGNQYCHGHHGDWVISYK